MEILYEIFYKYSVNILIDNLIDHIDNQGWDTVILEDIVDFRHDPDVAITTGEHTYTNDNGIQ